MTASSQIAQRVLQTLTAAALANQHTACRAGNLIEIRTDEAEDVLVAADLHGNRLNFRELCRLADLDAHPRRHLIMQEVCHGGPSYPASDGCMSHLLLEDVAELKTRYPERFHFLLSNHELAELTDYPITKANKMLNVLFRTGLKTMYGNAAEAVRRAFLQFVRTCPLAARLGQRVFVSHTTPAGVDREPFDATVLQRPLKDEDFAEQGAAFRLVWGRDFRQRNAAAFARLVAADVLIHGHEPCPAGFQIPNDYQIILDCSHPNASYLLLPVVEKMNQRQAVRCIRSLYPGGPPVERPDVELPR